MEYFIYNFNLLLFLIRKYMNDRYILCIFFVFVVAYQMLIGFYFFREKGYYE